MYSSSFKFCTASPVSSVTRTRLISRKDFGSRKRSSVRTWRRVSTEHLAAYLQEMTWRFSHREDPFLFRDTLQRLITSESLEHVNLFKTALPQPIARQIFVPL